MTTGGQLDTTGFGVNDGDGTDGVASVDFGGRNDYGRFVALQQGKIVVAGQTEPLWDSLNQVYVDPSYDANDPNDVQSLTSDLTVLRLNADGTLDTSFGVGGPEGDGLTQDDLRVTGDAWDYTYSMAITSGQCDFAGDLLGRLRLGSLQHNGVLDNSIADNPAYTAGRVDGQVGTIYALSEDADGNILTGETAIWAVVRAAISRWRGTCPMAIWTRRSASAVPTTSTAW